MAKPPVRTPPVADVEEAVLEETTKMADLIPATQEAIDLPACEIHNFVYLRSAKLKEKIKDREPGTAPTMFRRVDTFYCRHCLRYTTMARQEPSTIHPDWFRDDR